MVLCVHHARAGFPTRRVVLQGAGGSSGAFHPARPESLARPRANAGDSIAARDKPAAEVVCACIAPPFTISL